MIQVRVPHPSIAPWRALQNLVQKSAKKCKNGHRTGHESRVTGHDGRRQQSNGRVQEEGALRQASKTALTTWATLIEFMHRKSIGHCR